MFATQKTRGKAERRGLATSEVELNSFFKHQKDGWRKEIGQASVLTIILSSAEESGGKEPRQLSETISISPPAGRLFFLPVMFFGGGRAPLVHRPVVFRSGIFAPFVVLVSRSMRHLHVHGKRERNFPLTNRAYCHGKR
jgi:hypothetical protein